MHGPLTHAEFLLFQEVKLRSNELLKPCLSPAVRTSPRIVGRRDLAAAAGEQNSGSKAQLQQAQQHFGTASKAGPFNGMRMFGEPRQCVLHKGKKGFGFVLRGAKVIPSHHVALLKFKLAYPVRYGTDLLILFLEGE